jgi:phosphohistidine phosphatase
MWKCANLQMWKMALMFYITVNETVYLVRHAKSDWSGPEEDPERPLNDRGKRDAPMMANRLLERKAKVDRFVSSPAKRCIQHSQALLLHMKGRNQIL